MIYTISKEAVKDLSNIGRYTEKIWGRAQRRHYLSLLGQKFNAISEQPLLNHERLEFTPPIRIQHFQAHLIIYQATVSNVLIIRVLHKNMSIEDQLTVLTLKP